MGTKVFPLVIDVARRFGKKRIILWGGVLADNPRAIGYYKKQGFQIVGSFTNTDGAQAFDMILNLPRSRGSRADQQLRWRPSKKTPNGGKPE